MSKPSTSTAALSEALEEPSPIDRRLTEGRSWNDGNWSSHEMKMLYDALAKYGTKPKPLKYIAQNAMKGRTYNEIDVKLFEIRQMISENRDDCREYHKKIWEDKGYREILELLNIDEMTWIRAADTIDKNTHVSINKYKNPMRDEIQIVFNEAQKAAKEEKDVKVTDSRLARVSNEKTDDIRWELIYKFMNSCLMMDDTLPALNELEASIVLSVLQGIEDEASNISEEEKSVLCGMLTDIHDKDLRAFEPDTPCNQKSAVQALVDPFRVRLFGIPEIGAEPDVSKETK